jgi:hypothetical protein
MKGPPAFKPRRLFPVSHVVEAVERAREAWSDLQRGRAISLSGVRLTGEFQACTMKSPACRLAATKFLRSKLSWASSVISVSLPT